MSCPVNCSFSATSSPMNRGWEVKPPTQRSSSLICLGRRRGRLKMAWLWMSLHIYMQRQYIFSQTHPRTCCFQIKTITLFHSSRSWQQRASASVHPLIENCAQAWSPNSAHILTSSRKWNKSTPCAFLDLDAWPSLSAFIGLNYSRFNGGDLIENNKIINGFFLLQLRRIIHILSVSKTARVSIHPRQTRSTHIYR